MPSTDRDSQTRPRQLRSAETRRRLLDAAEALIEEKGLADASIPEIVRRAGSSVGGFYARFHDKDALFRALEDRFSAELYERLDKVSSPARWAGAPLAEIVRPSIEELVGTFRERAALIRCFIVRAGGDEDRWEEGLRFRREVAARFVALAAERPGEVRHPEPALAVELAVHIAFAFVQQAALFGDVHAGGRALRDAELVDELTRNMLGYLGIAEPAAAPTHSRRKRS